MGQTLTNLGWML